MARAGVTEEQIREAIAALEADGVAVTVQGIRGRLGTGSFTTLQAALDRWKADRKREKVTGVPEAPGKVLALTQAVWGEAWKAASDAHDAERKALSDERQRFGAERSALAAEIARLEAALAAAEELGERDASRAAALADELGRVRLELARGSERCGAAEGEAARVREELRAVRRELTAWVERASRAETRLEHLEADTADGKG